MTACELCKGACCESILLPIDASPTTTEFYAARGEVFMIVGRTFAELPSRCPHLSQSGKCKTYDNRPVACSRFAVGSTMCVTAIQRRRPDQADAIMALLA
jgi:Fe-S-cluster containining protein